MARLFINHSKSGQGRSPQSALRESSLAEVTVLLHDAQHFFSDDGHRNSRTPYV
jgi:hypothetical protein